MFLCLEFHFWSVCPGNSRLTSNTIGGTNKFARQSRSNQRINNVDFYKLHVAVAFSIVLSSYVDNEQIKMVVEDFPADFV